MNLPSSSCRTHVVEVVARCIERGQGPGDVLAQMPALRGTTSALRGEVVAWARRVVGARLRLERALGAAKEGPVAGKAEGEAAVRDGVQAVRTSSTAWCEHSPWNAGRRRRGRIPRCRRSGSACGTRFWN